MGRHIVTLWSGLKEPELPRLQYICMRSWLAQGYEVTVYCYKTIPNLPEGVRQANADEILDRSEVFFVSGNNWAHFSDVFRLELLRQNLGTWLDADLLLLRPLPEDRPMILGWERRGLVCNAAMAFPEHHEIPRYAMEYYRGGKLGPWAHVKPRWQKFLSMLMGKNFDYSSMPHGHWGQHMLGYYNKKMALYDQLLPQKALYHPSTYDGSLFQDVPYDHLMDDDEVLGVHFFFKQADYDNPVPGSFFADMCQRHDPRDS